MVASPAIAVIVGAYQRSGYLLGAVRSVLAQSVSRDSVEIVVTKDFADPEIDAALARDGVRTLLDGDPSIGPWLRRAVAASSAPLLAFLDDDDAFEAGRLARVLEVFADHPEVGFYRNRVRVVDADDRPVPVDRWSPLCRDPAFDASGPVVVAPNGKADLVDLALVRTHASFNSSTMVLRRELLTGTAGALFDRTQLPDLALFLAGALSSTGLFLDDRRLTRYRNYPGNVTRRTRWLREAARCHHEGAEAAGRLGRPDFERWLRSEGDHFERLFMSATLVDHVAEMSPRREVAHRAVDYLRFLARHPDERAARLDVWAAEAYAAAYLLAPRFTGRLRRARKAQGAG